jgi:LmbE family N-acetylglucosaminyl deacetylase
MIAAAFAAVILLAGLTLALRLRRYRAGFHEPVRRDDLLTFGGASEPRRLSMSPDGFDVPAGLTAGPVTALLRLHVEATLTGHWRDPFIELSGGQRQYFERGVAGHRYLDVSPLFHDGERPAHVGLHGRGLRWRRDASLEVFAAPAGESVMVLAPHPDDAEIAAFGLYAGRPSWVVTVTAGDIGADLPALVPPADKGRWNALLRVGDSLTIPQLGQVPPERCVNLAYPDGALAGMYEETTRPFKLACEDSLPRSALRSRNHAPEMQTCEPGCTWNDLLADLRVLLARAQPALVACPHPCLDIHPDHVFTAVALAQVLRDLAKPPGVLLYLVHGRGVPCHPLGPAESCVGPPPWHDRRWVAESLYSHPLPPQLRVAKYFAVEAMHDVRRYEEVRPRSVSGLLGAIATELTGFIAGIGPHPTSFLRRAPRPNELYFVVSAAGLAELAARALESRGGDGQRGSTPIPSRWPTI